MQSIIYFLYTLNCLALIFAVLIQQPQTQGSAGYGTALFGSAGSKDVLYRTTQFLIAGFFILAFMITMMDYQQQQLDQKMYLTEKLMADLPSQPEAALL